MGDFGAFYCGGTMVREGVSPYAAAPLLKCERSPQPFGLHVTRPGIALPAPFPGYVLSIFVPISLLPYPVAAALWFILLLAATAVACIFLAQLCGRPVLVPFVLLAFGLAVAVIPYGELAPLGIAALAFGAAALRQEFSWKVIVALAVLALLPPIALPVYLAVFVYRAAARLPIVLLGSSLIVLDLVTGGPQVAFAYFRHVLPNHAASEIGYIMQYSMTWLVQGLGAPDRVALLSGTISYVLMAGAGVYLSGQLARSLRDPAFLLLVPAGFAVIGGPFVHYSEITLALPAALLLYCRSSGNVRNVAALAIVTIALPWQWILTQPLLAIPIVFWTLGIVSVVLSAPFNVTLRVGFAAAVFCAACMALAVIYGPQVAPHAATVILDQSLAEASWGNFIAAKLSTNGLVWWIGKAPTWIGLILLASACAAATWIKRPDPGQQSPAVA